MKKIFLLVFLFLPTLSYACTPCPPDVTFCPPCTMTESPTEQSPLNKVLPFLTFSQVHACASLSSFLDKSFHLSVYILFHPFTLLSIVLVGALSFYKTKRIKTSLKATCYAFISVLLLLIFVMVGSYLFMYINNKDNKSNVHLNPTLTTPC